MKIHTFFYNKHQSFGLIQKSSAFTAWSFGMASPLLYSSTTFLFFSPPSHDLFMFIQGMVTFLRPHGDMYALDPHRQAFLQTRTMFQHLVAHKTLIYQVWFRWAHTGRTSPGGPHKIFSFELTHTTKKKRRWKIWNSECLQVIIHHQGQKRPSRLWGACVYFIKPIIQLSAKAITVSPLSSENICSCLLKCTLQPQHKPPSLRHSLNMVPTWTTQMEGFLFPLQPSCIGCSNGGK